MHQQINLTIVTSYFKFYISYFKWYMIHDLIFDTNEQYILSFLDKKNWYVHKFYGI